MRCDGPVGTRLAKAAALARTPWLMFLGPGTVPEPAWVEGVQDFMRGDGQAASFRRPSRSVLDFFGPRIRPEQGLLISARAYAQAGGHPASEDAEAVLLRKVRPALLAATARPPIT